MRIPACSLARLSWLLACGVCGAGGACGHGDRADDTTAATPTQITSVSEPGTSEPTTSTDPTTTATTQATTTTTTSDDTSAQTTGPLATASTSTSDPTSPGDTGFNTGFNTGFDTGFDCVQSLQATVRDFRTDHPDFEAYVSQDGLKGIVADALGPDMKPVYLAPGPTAQTSGPAAYAQWYANTPDINIAFAIDLPLTEVMPGLFSFASNAFFPVDDQGWGNEGNPHNFHFTTVLGTV